MSPAVVVVAGGRHPGRDEYGGSRRRPSGWRRCFARCARPRALAMMLLPRSAVRIYAAREPREPAQILRGTVRTRCERSSVSILCAGTFFVSESPSHAGESCCCGRAGALHDRAQAVGAWALHVSRPRVGAATTGVEIDAHELSMLLEGLERKPESERDAVGAGVSRDGLTKSGEIVSAGRWTGIVGMVFVMSRERRGQEDVEPE